MTDYPQKKSRLNDYGLLLAQKVDNLEAATRVFGDLKQLQSGLEKYIQQTAFRYFKMTTTTEVDDSAFKVLPLTSAQSGALRADFLAYNQRTTDAQALLDRVLQEDPKNAAAFETKGFLAFEQHNLEEAKKWYGLAVQYDSQSYLAHYYFATIAIMSSQDPSARDRAESSLRACVKLNPKFAPAFDELGALLAMQHKNLDEARTMGLTAVSLEPSNIRYRINVSNILLTMEKADIAFQVLQAASKVAKTPEEGQMVADALTRAQEYSDAKKQYETQRMAQEQVSDSETVNAKTDRNIPKLKRRDFVPKGPHRFATGTLKSITCDNPGLDLTVVISGKSLALHADNYYKIGFSTLGFQPSGDLNPCTDLESRPAKVEYIESANPAVSAQLISVELHK